MYRDWLDRNSVVNFSCLPLNISLPQDSKEKEKERFWMPSSLPHKEVVSVASHEASSVSKLQFTHRALTIIGLIFLVSFLWYSSFLSWGF